MIKKVENQYGSYRYILDDEILNLIESAAKFYSPYNIDNFDIYDKDNENNNILNTDQFFKLYKKLLNNYNDFIKRKDPDRRNDSFYGIKSSLNNQEILDKYVEDEELKRLGTIIENKKKSLKNICGKYDDLGLTYDKVRILENNDEADLYEELIKLFYEVGKRKYMLQKMEDVEDLSKNVFENLYMLCNKNEVDAMKLKYERLHLQASEESISACLSYLKELQKIIIDDWKKNITKIEDYVPGEKYKIIGHSMWEIIEGDFLSSLVSCSMFTEKFKDTYHCGFGFLFAPDDIIAADSKDLGIYNYAKTGENIYQVGLGESKINCPSKIEKELGIQLEEKKKKKQTGKILSEIVISKFKPIGIFCFTNGSKNFHSNYRSASALKEKYPNLKILNINYLLYDEVDFQTQRDILVSSIFDLKLFPEKFDQSKGFAYNMFFEEYYSKIKKSIDLSEDEIYSMFMRNKKIVESNIDDLLTSNYTNTEIRYGITNNINHPFIINKSTILHSIYELRDYVLYYEKYLDNPKMMEIAPDLIELIKLLKYNDFNENFIIKFNSETDKSMQTLLGDLKQALLPSDDNIINNFNK